MYKTSWRETILLWLFSIVNLPMIFWLKPRVIELTDARCIIMMPFRRRSRNHVKSMYFGALCAGADLAGGIMAMKLFKKQKEKFTFVFKDLQADFLKRCEADVYFVCDEGARISETIQRALQTRQRENVTLNVTATIPALFKDEPVATFKLTLSLKPK
jgi:acyl-coenzyme A thioesterase PaaI-like protein